MQDLEYVRAYIDDLLVITSGSLEDHLEKLKEVLQRLRKAGLKVNAKKSFFAREELEYLGYWITRDGIQPTVSKVKAIGAIEPPQTKKQLRRFIGMVNYYRDMWGKRSEILAPLASLTSKQAKWKWEPEHQKAFEDMKAIISREAMLAYPDFNEEFVIHTDASHSQLGAVISQKGKPIAFYSRKLKPEQTRYTTTERELLSIVETLKEFRNILLGQKIVVYTDHKNLTYKNFNTERVMRWRLILEEYGPELRYIKGEHNVVADALSRLDMHDESPFEDPSDEAAALYMAELCAVDPAVLEGNFPLSYQLIQLCQKDDAEIKRYLARKVNGYVESEFPSCDKSFRLVTYKDKIVVPKALQKRVVQWYHEVLMHPGEPRTELTIAQHYTWKGMRKTIQDVCQRCKSCQLWKKSHLKMGHLPEKTAEDIPWEKVCIDLIGPYTVGDEKKKDDVTVLHALTMIDPVTGWFEIAEIPAKSADVVINVLEQTWLSRYPYPSEVVMDRGSEFMGEVQRGLRQEYGARIKTITTRNPQANAMVERAHQTVKNMIRSQNIQSRADLEDGNWLGTLNAVAFAMRATVHTTNRATPFQLVFGRDAIHNIGFEADWQYLKERRQRMIRHNNERENAKRVPHTYTVGDSVKVEQPQHRKYGTPRYRGPYTVDRVNTNGTLRLRVPKGVGAVYETWNIRNLHPYRD
jgi:hypothetical protein